MAIGKPTEDGKYDIGIVSDNTESVNRMKAICEEFGYSFTHWKGLEEILKEPKECKIILGWAASRKSKEAAAEFAQVLRHACREAFIVCTVAGALGKEIASFVKKSGANVILRDDEMINGSKMEYVCTQVIRADLLTIKTSDLTPGKPLTFDVYHLLPQRGKFLKFAYEGSELTAEKIKKLAEVGELYIHKSAAEKFNQYTKDNVDRTAAGLARRCRAQFLALYASYSKLVLLLTDQSEHASFEEGNRLLQECRKLATELISALGALGDAWEIVNNSTIGEFGSTERAPAVAAYVALFALQIDMNDAEDVMIAALLSDLGLLLLPPSISKKIRHDQVDKMTAEELDIYHKYPMTSLDLVLSRKLPVEERIRELLLSTHERADGKGFPRGISGKRLSDGAQLIQFCRQFDQRTLVKMGRARVNRAEMQKKIIDEELQNPGRFSPVFVTKLKKALT